MLPIARSLIVRTVFVIAALVLLYFVALAENELARATAQARSQSNQCLDGSQSRRMASPPCFAGGSALWSGSSKPLRELVPSDLRVLGAAQADAPEHEPPTYEMPYSHLLVADPVLQEAVGPLAMPTPGTNWEGIARTTRDLTFSVPD